MPSGGIGATINVKTRRPLDTPGTQASFGVKALSDTSNEEGSDITPEVSGIFQLDQRRRDHWLRSVRRIRRARLWRPIGQTNDWVVRTASNIMANTGIVRAGGDPANYVNMPPDGELFAIPQDSRYDVADLTSERLNAQADRSSSVRPTRSR